MIPSDHVVRSTQWGVTAGSSGSPKPDYVDIRLNIPPQPIHFTLNPQDANNLAGAFMAVINHLTEESISGEFKVSIASEQNEAGIPLLKLELPKTFHEERSVYFSLKVSYAFANELLEISQSLIQ